MKRANVYLRKNELILGPIKKTAMGLGICTGPYEVLPIEASFELVFSKLMLVLEQSQEVLPHPRDWRGMTDNLQKVARVKSYKTFINGTKLCEVELDDFEIRILPTANGGAIGSNKGFHHLQTKEVKLKADNRSMVISKLLELLANVCK